MTNRFGLPYLGFGLGLRFPHYQPVLEQKPEVGWFEVISENFMEAHPGYRDYLADLRAHYPLVLHGVSLSLGSADPLNTDYLKKLRTLADHVRAPWVSDHLCWTGVHGKNTHDLLPVPYTREMLRHMTARTKKVQDALGRPLLLENPSSYLDFAASEMPEAEFLAALAEAADCALLLDVNNVYVSAFNHGFDAERYLRTLPAGRVVQIHLAGHRHCGTHIIDTHDDHVIDEVWALYEQALRMFGPVSTMIEWDEDIPEFGVLLEEMHKARKIAERIHAPAHAVA